ncbi:MAG: tetratricopeptide repeat protein [Gammaproteobacteria bacterium]
MFQKHHRLTSLPQDELVNGNLYMTQNNLPMAIKCYQRVEKSVVALNKMGIAYYLLHEWDNARECFRAAADANPADADYAINYQKLNKLIEIIKIQKERSLVSDIDTLFITDPKKYRAAFLLSRGKSPHPFKDFEQNKKPQRRGSVPLSTLGQRRFTLFEGVFVKSLPVDQKDKKPAKLSNHNVRVK